MKEIRVYPQSCLSMYCGKVDCTNCKFRQELEEFKQWVTKNRAVVTDPIWCPTVYESTLES